MSPRVSPEPREVFPAAGPGAGASEPCIPREQRTLPLPDRLAGSLLERLGVRSGRALPARPWSGGW